MRGFHHGFLLASTFSGLSILSDIFCCIPNPEARLTKTLAKLLVTLVCGLITEAAIHLAPRREKFTIFILCLFLCFAWFWFLLAEPLGNAVNRWAQMMRRCNSRQDGEANGFVEQELKICVISEKNSSII